MGESLFNRKIYSLISETESNIYDIEKIIFTHRYKYSEKDFSILSKQSIVMLYSLWEGFIQEVFGLFLEEVNKHIDTIFELCDEFMLSQIEYTFPQFFSYPQNLDKKVKFHKSLNEFQLLEKHELRINVNCKNNVELSVLNDLLVSHGMAYIPDNWKSYSRPNNNVKDILKSFLKFRNNQAHGNKIMTEVIMTHKEYEVYKNLIIDLIYEVGKKIMDSIFTKNYLKA